MNALNVEETVRDFWSTRPRRSADGRKVAGVAAGVGRRYGVDPLLVRVAFVVTTVYGGAGALLYALGWLLLPDGDDEVSGAEGLIGRGRSSMPQALVVLLGVAVLTVGWVVFDIDGLVALVLAGGALFMLHRYRAGLGEVPAVRQPAPDAAPHTGPPSAGERAAPTGQVPAQPPSWDPLGAAPFAWDLPEPGPVPTAPPPEPRGPGSRVTVVTLGVALLAAGATAAFVPAVGPAQIAAVALGAVGLGLLVGSLCRGGRGLIGIAVPLALVTWLLHAVPVADLRVGEGRWDPVSAAQVEDRYGVTMGNGRLDLTGLDLADDQTVRTALSVPVGEAQVILPADADVELVCRVPVGNVDCLGETSAGLFGPGVEHSDNGIDGPGGGRIVLDVRAGMGNVRVIRGLGEGN